jgi:hypothetical protein
MSALSSGSPQPYSLSRQNVLNAVHASKIQASASQKMAPATPQKPQMAPATPQKPQMAPATPQKPQIDWIKYLSIGLGLLLVGTLGMVGIKAGQKVLKEAEEAERLAAEEAKKKLKNTSPENKVDRLIKEQEQKLEEANQRRRQAQGAKQKAEEARKQAEAEKEAKQKKLEEAKKQQEEFLRKEKELQDAELEKTRKEAEEVIRQAKARREQEEVRKKAEAEAQRRADEARRQAQAEAQRRADEARRQSSNSYGQASSSQNNQGYGNNGSRYGGNHSQGTNRASGSKSPPPPQTPRELRDEKLKEIGRRRAGTPSQSELIKLFNEIATLYDTPRLGSNPTKAELKSAWIQANRKLHPDALRGKSNQDTILDNQHINSINDLLKTHHIK